jgi:hypothetical protein
MCRQRHLQPRRRTMLKCSLPCRVPITSGWAAIGVGVPVDGYGRVVIGEDLHTGALSGLGRAMSIEAVAMFMCMAAGDDSDVRNPATEIILSFRAGRVPDFAFFIQ